MKKFARMREELANKAEREAMRLFRLARQAEKHNAECTAILIRREAHDLLTNYKTYPERLLAWDFEYKFKYAFR